MPEDKTIVCEGSYQGKPTLIFGDGSRFPFTFGQAKARLLLIAINAMGKDAFVEMLLDFTKGPGASK